jgi:hypothetical protein
MKMRLLNLLLIPMLILSGCATVVTGKYQEIPVTSEPTGIKVRTDTGVSIITPGKFSLLRNQNHILVAECPGVEPHQFEIKHKLQGWFWGNILLGGIIGGVVDASSGSSDKLIPNRVHFYCPERGAKDKYR